MKIAKMQYVIVMCVCVAAFSFSAIAGASDIAEVVNNACTKCHSPKRICLNMGVKSESAWKTTVERMIKKGAKVPAERAEEASMYLAKLGSDNAPFCK